MNLLLLDAREVGDDGIARITGSRLAHLREVQRYTAGDRLRVGVVNGQLGTGEILAIDGAGAEIRVTLDQDPPAPAPVTLVLALPRPKMIKRILVDATSLGVKRVHFINSYRVDKSFWQSPLLAPEAIEEKCRLGLEQAIDTRLPAVTLHPRFRPFAEDVLPGLLAGSTALVAHPEASTACPQAVAGPFTLVVGPEGGFIPFEVDLLVRAGCTPVTLGPRVLRVDTAIPTLLGRLLAG
ncbi:MAG: 16S rRNA (uracil(1498)-N(3))-methyltransferase [Gammaproteobacteria bacterium]